MKQAIVWIKTIAALPVLFFILSVIRQKDESQNGCFKKTKYAKFPKNKIFLSPDTHTRTPIPKFSPMQSFVFLKHPFWDLPFYLIADESSMIFEKSI